MLAFLMASGCGDELGGDGWMPPRPMNEAGGGASSLGGLNSGGVADQAGAGGEAPAHGGKGGGGKGGKGGGGSGGKGGKGGGGSGGTPLTEGGTGNTDAGTGGGPTSSVCGNGVTEPPYEDCDDGNTDSGDACPANCLSACETCEKTYCKAVRSNEAGQHGWVLDATLAPVDAYTNCFDMPGESAGGLAPGIPRADLCQAAVDCARREKCAQFVPNNLTDQSISTFQFLRCYCDLDITSRYATQCSSPDTLVKGKCWREFQEAAEINNSAVFGTHFNANLPFGAANHLLLGCDKKLCQEECFPQSSAGAVAEISADILWTSNPAGESPLGDLIADAHRAALGTDFALLVFPLDTFLGNYGPEGLRVEATPGRAADATGRVLESELGQALHGMNPRPPRVHQFTGNKLVTLQLTGQQLYDTLNNLFGQIHVSGLSYTWDETLPSLKKVTEIRKGGIAIDKAGSYSVTANDVTASSIVGNTVTETAIVGGISVVVSDKDSFRETIAYLKALPQPVAPPTLDRVTRLN